MMDIDDDALNKYLKLIRKRNRHIMKLDAMQLELDKAKDELNKETYDQIFIQTLAYDDIYFPTRISFTIHREDGKPFLYSSTTEQDLYDRLEDAFEDVKTC
jgi:hypothetical protein